MPVITKTRWYKFWIKSSRGTDSHTFVQLPHHLSKADIKERLEEWCSGFGAWVVSENYMHYGWAKVRKPTQVWLKQQEAMNRRSEGLLSNSRKTRREAHEKMQRNKS